MAWSPKTLLRSQNVDALIASFSAHSSKLIESLAFVQILGQISAENWKVLFD